MMVVLLDLEWIEDHGNNLTQLSAVRTDERWREVSRLDRLVRASSDCLRFRRHMAFGGYSRRFQRRGNRCCQHMA